MESVTTNSVYSIVSTALFGAILLFLGKFFLDRQIMKAKLPYPVASGSIPVVGAAVDFGMKGLEFLRQKHKELGNVFLVDLLFLRFHFVLGPKCIQAFYKASNDDLNFLAAVPDIMPELVEDAWDQNPDFQSKGHALVLKGFTMKEKLEHAYRLVVEEADKAFAKWTKMDKVDIFDECSRMTILVTLRFIIGDELYHERGEEIADLYDLLEKDLADPLVMTLRPLPTKPYRRLLKSRDALLNIMKESVSKRIENQEKYKNDGSFLQFLMDELGPDHWYQYAFLCLGIILATRTNTANVLAWTISHLCYDDALKKKVVDELEELKCHSPGVGDSMESPYPFSKFSFLDACMKESIRSYSNFMQFRKVTKEGGFEVEPGKIIPQGALICISPAESHHDETIFEDPYVYKPDRWLSNEYWATRSREMAFVQWGFLRHRCYGEKWAQQFDKVVWARLFSKFNVTSAVNNQPVPTPLWGSGFGTSFPIEGQHYYVKISPKA